MEMSNGEKRASEEDDLEGCEYGKVTFDRGRTLFRQSPAS